MYGNVGGGNYGAVGQKLNQQQINLHGINAEASPDYGKIAEEAIKGRSRERKAAIAAEAAVHQTGLAEMSMNKQYKIKAETEKAVADIKKPAQRMAGVVGAAGTIAGAWMLNKGNKEAEARALELEAKRAERHKETMAALNKPRPKPEPLEKPPVMEMPTLLKPGDSTSGQGGNVAPGATKTKPGKGSSPVGPVTQQQGYQLLIDQGMDHHNATIGAAVMMAESRGKPKALNPDGEHSVGLWQHNRDTGEDRHAFYGISDWSELEDPVVNARATYRLWKRQGGWTPWGAFTNGSYKDFL